MVVQEANQVLNVPVEPELPSNPDRDDLAKWYAQHYLSPKGFVREVIYLPEGSPEWEIRLVNVNTVRSLPPTDEVEPLDMSSPLEDVHPHAVLVVDVAADQWERLLGGRVRLPEGWSLGGYRIIRLGHE